MSDIKWIKLSIDVFDDEKFDAIRTLPDANDIQLVWVKLLCLAGKCNESGFLMLTSEIPYTDEMLASKFKMEIGVIQRSLALFQKLNMIDVIDNVYMVSNWTKYQSLDAYEKKKEYDRNYQAKRYAEKKHLLEEKKNSRTRIKREKVRESYDFVLNSNTSNLLYILNNNLYKDTNYLKENKRLFNIIKRWMEYKQEKFENEKNKSDHYGTKQGIFSMLTTFINKDKELGTDEVERAVEMTMGNNYHGVVWDYAKRSQNKSNVDNKMKMLFGDRT